MVFYMLEGWERANELRQELKNEWAMLWKTKYDDRVKAEDVSSKEFERLFVVRGEIIQATRDYKPLSFREILNRNLGTNLAERINPDPSVGGWHKFARDHLQKPHSKRRKLPKVKFDSSQHQKKDCRGWLNKARVLKKIRHCEHAD
jgi:hypothetical protein